MEKHNGVQVINKNEGEKIAYNQDGTCLLFDNDVMVNIAEYQKDWGVQVDICRDRAGNLTIGTGSAQRYVAQIMIPAAKYTEHTEGEGEEKTATREKIDIDMGEVVLYLWSIE